MDIIIIVIIIIVGVVFGIKEIINGDSGWKDYEKECGDL